MAGKERPSPLFIAFLAFMLLIMLIGLFLLVWGSMHNTVPVPSLPGDGLFAWVTSHA